MNTKDIRTSSDPDLAGSYAAILRAARSAQDIAIQTNTAILVSIDGKDVCLTADDIKKLREKEKFQKPVEGNLLTNKITSKINIIANLNNIQRIFFVQTQFKKDSYFENVN